MLRRRLGKTGIDVTILGLGGEGVLRTHGHDDEAYAVINRAIDLGINYFDCAKAYAGSESYYGKSLRERRNEIFLTSKSHERTRDGAWLHLVETLRTMQTDHLDLWQVHDVREEAEIEEIFGPGGAIEAFVQAKQQGLVRFIGVTGHHDPVIIRQCIERFNFDTVLMPVNPAEPHDRSFIEGVLPFAVANGMGVIAMKVYFRGLAARIQGVATLEPFLRFALSHPVSTAIIGCDTVEQVEENVRFAEAFTPMGKEEKELLVADVGLIARRLMYYKP